MIRIWCEWDIGQEYLVFSSEEKARKWLESHWPRDSGFINWQEAWAEGFMGFQSLTLDPK